MMNDKQKRILSITLASWGVIMIGSGLIMNASVHPIIKTTYSLDINHVKVNESKTNEIVLKEITIEINNPLSVNVKDYLENVDQIDTETLKSLKLDTSMVKINEAGTYTYTISFKKKKYNGTVIVKEKNLANIELKLKDIRIELGKSLTVPSAANNFDYSLYVENELTEEMKDQMQLDITKVDTSTENEYGYDYYITYNGTKYQGKVFVYTPTPSNPVKQPATPEASQKPVPEKHSCQIVDGWYYDANGNTVSKENYEKSCNITSENNSEQSEEKEPPLKP